MCRWGIWMETHSRVVKQETFFDGTDLVSVSTVFLGLDHNFTDSGTPLLFETMAFGGQHDQEMRRYHTWEEAETGHRLFCEQLGLIQEQKINDT